MTITILRVWARFWHSKRVYSFWAPENWTIRDWKDSHNGVPNSFWHFIPEVDCLTQRRIWISKFGVCVGPTPTPIVLIFRKSGSTQAKHMAGDTIKESESGCWIFVRYSPATHQMMTFLKRTFPWIKEEFAVITGSKGTILMAMTCKKRSRKYLPILKIGHVVTCYSRNPLKSNTP